MTDGPGTPAALEAWAHVAQDGRPHLLRDHLRAVSAIAARFGEAVGAPAAAALAGLWHDVGKFSGDFQHMIRRENGIEAHIEVEGGPRDHSTAGALHALERLGAGGYPVAAAIAGHHAGLDDPAGLRTRFARRASLLAAVQSRRPDPEIMAPPTQGWRPAWLGGACDPLDAELWTRLLFSCLCDADFLDTEAFFSPDRAALREQPTLICSLLDRLRTHLDKLSRRDTEVNRARADVRAACVAAAESPPGIFSLTVPTGGGKTLASMAFALEHAVQHDLDRVVVAIPFTSILEQTAQVYRDIFGDGAVIEHHSALDPDRETARNRIASENWDAPIIVTTTVQLFESLLSNRPRQCRKLHNLARSVIVLDEAQSLPGQLLPVILDVLTRLAASYRTSVVISTATQPALGRSAVLREGFASIREICPPELRLFERLQRVRVTWPSEDAPTSYERIAEQVAGARRCLAIVHRRNDAAELCRLVDQELADVSTIHLSALMTPTHRRVVLERVRQALAGQEPVRVIATQLVEAGVDVDFPLVLRAFGGLDSLAQAAGRCNREGRLSGLGELHVFFAPTEPPPGIARTGRDVARILWRADPGLDLFSSAAQARYFEQLYASLDLSSGRDLQAKRRELKFASVARGTETEDGFRMITADWAAPLVVAHSSEAQARVAAVEHGGPSRQRLRALQSYVVNVPRRALDAWLRGGFVRTVAETVVVLDGPGVTAAYDQRFGLQMDRVGNMDPAVLVV